MVKRYIPFVIAALVAVFTDISHSLPVSAAVNYDFEYDELNRYNTELVTYTFSNLDSNTTYTWGVYTVSINDGTLLALFGTFTSTPADRSGSPTDETWQFGGVDFSTPLGTVNYPQGYSGPIAVVDMSNGTILSRHFVAELPTFVTTQESEWFVSGNTTVGEKQATGPTTFEGPCRNVIYNEINVDGWQHSFLPCSVTTHDDGWTLLHYQLTAAYDPAMDDHTINFFLIPDAVISFAVSINELIDYQYTDPYTPGVAQFNFVVLNTAGRFLSFLDNTRCANAFTSGMNPCLSDFDPGVYNYSRNNGGWISDGESVMIVTDDPSLNEWTLTANVDDVGEGGTQTLVARAVTPEVWESYHGFQQVADVLAGFSDTTVYSFARARNHSYTVASVVTNDVTAQWINRAAAINSGLATPEEMEFEVQTFYDIVDIVTFEENVNQVLINTGLDTDSGRAALLTIILFVGMLGTAAFPGIRSNIFAYLVVWTGLGSVYILGGFGTLLVSTVYIVLTIGMWLFAILMLQTGWENENS